MVRVNVGEHDLFNVVRLNVKLAKRCLPGAPGAAGIEATVYHRPASLATQQITIDDPQSKRERNLHLKYVGGNGRDQPLRGHMEGLYSPQTLFPRSQIESAP